jgi:hypothetical protein
MRSRFVAGMPAHGGAPVPACVRLWFGCMAWGMAACSDAAGPLELAQPDAERFAADVYPVLLRDCAMSECHGSSQRFFRVVGPGRVRLSKATQPLEPATDAEIMASYDRARSMLVPAPHADQSLLLRKPLELAAGGASHMGRDAFGRNVYATKDDPGYVAITQWAMTTAPKAEP